MGKFWAWAAGILIAVCILGLLASSKPPQHRQGSVYVVIRSSTAEQAGPQAPPGDWLLVRRIPHPTK